ncbi:hypothetical protein A7U60_g7879 [Sanghuangporus baumii]|uniref:SAGA-associated factor 11 n=1 Tax=Sanghuangporus baumii TaxID=108892 RepID=A0A9Q5HSX8_SANBA|nr:hypothetical protein A7U60_g7879 [Sanghuangporus baumii]
MERRLTEKRDTISVTDGSALHQLRGNFELVIMSKGDKETVLNDLTSRIFSSMLGEVAMDAAIQAQKEVRRIHAVSATAPVPGTSRAGSPGIEGSSQPGTSTPGGSAKTDGNINLDCVNCQRPIASNRYAQHLATCLGIGTGVKGGKTGVHMNYRTSANNRSGSPYVDDAEDTRSIKGKSKARARAAGADEDVAGSQKQAGTSQPSPSKKQKKASGTGPPRLPANRLGPPSSGSKPPSKLRSTPTPSVVSHLSKNSRSPSAHSDSSDAEGDSGAEAESQSHSSIIGGTSPSLPNAESIGRGRSKTGSFSLGPGSASGAAASKPKKVTGTGPPKKPPPPPAHQLPTLAPPPPPPVRRPESTFLIDIEGEETGSDTD